MGNVVEPVRKCSERDDVPGDPSHIAFLDFDVVATVRVGADVRRIDHGARRTPATRLDVVSAVLSHTNSIVPDRSIPLDGIKAILVGRLSGVVSYRVIDPDDLEPTPDRDCDRRPIGEAAGLEQFALNRYIADPGETVPLTYHYHDEQEEAFAVLDGTLRVETPAESYTVTAGEVFVADPESPHRAFVASEADAPATVLAVGAPAVDDAHPYETDG